jgi:hypothetical protein
MGVPGFVSVPCSCTSRADLTAPRVVLYHCRPVTRLSTVRPNTTKVTGDTSTKGQAAHPGRTDEAGGMAKPNATVAWSTSAKVQPGSTRPCRR